MQLLKLSSVIILVTTLLFSCNPLKQLQSDQTLAETSYSNGKYEQAYNQLSALITKYNESNIPVPYNIYFKTGKSASEIGKINEASNYYKEALKDSVTIDAVKGFIGALSQTAQYDKISDAINVYKDFLNKNGEEEYLTALLFQNAVSMGKAEEIEKTYPDLDKPNEEQSMLYIKSLEELGKEKEALKFCNNLVKNNPEYYKAKEWKAIYYYNLAEEMYKSEMAKYNKDKNYTAYVYLKRDLKKVSANFQIAKGEFEDLHKAKPEEKKYIKYLKNIYLRLEMKKEAAAMDNLLK